MGDSLGIILLLMVLISQLLMTGAFLYIVRIVLQSRSITPEETSKLEDDNDSQYNIIKDDLKTVPLENFTPDPSKPVKLVYREEGENTILEEVEDDK